MWSLCTCKVIGVLIVGISGLPSGSLGTKSHLDVALVESCRVYYKGEGGGFPQVRAVVSLVCSSCLWLILTPKMFQLCGNHPLLVLCRFMWIIEACQFFLIPSWNSSMPSYPPKCCEPGGGPDSLGFRCFQFGIHIWVRQGVGSVSIGTLSCHNGTLWSYWYD
jgi:hypothetical protein